jgi:hypothetical protein
MHHQLEQHDTVRLSKRLYQLYVLTARARAKSIEHVKDPLSLPLGESAFHTAYQRRASPSRLRPLISNLTQAVPAYRMPSDITSESFSLT